MRFLHHFVVLLLVSSGAFGQKHNTDDWARREAFVNPAILDEKLVQTWEGGRWLEEGIEGTYRFIITEVKPGEEKLYVQWLVGDKELAYSMSIKELNVRPEYDIEMPVCSNDLCASVLVTAKHTYEETQSKFTLTLLGLGRYAFSM